MTREQLEKIKAKISGPDVAALIAEVERLWADRARLADVEQANRVATDLLAQMEARALTAEAEAARLRGVLMSVLREVEWGGHNGVCLFCRRTQYRLHAPECQWVSALFDAARKERP